MQLPAQSSRQPSEDGSDDSQVALFRQEVLNAQQSQWLGTVLVVPKVSQTLLSLLSLTIAAAIVALMYFGHYTRKERVNGWLVPQLGMVRVFAPQQGVVTELNVKEDSLVEQGAALMVVSTELQSEALGATQQEITDRLRSRRNSLVSERKLQADLHDQKGDGLSRRIDALSEELLHRKRELVTQRERIKLADEAIERLRPLRAQGLVVEQRWRQVEDDWFEQTARLRRLVRDVSATERKRVEMQTQLSVLPLEKKNTTGRDRSQHRHHRTGTSRGRGPSARSSCRRRRAAPSRLFRSSKAVA